MITDSFNKRLKALFGHDLLGRQHFRLVWSDDQIEKRMGDFHNFYGDLYLNTTFGTSEVPKYQKYAKHRWVLERLTWVPRNMNKEIVPLTDDGATYEPVYVYTPIDADLSPPPMSAIIFTIHCFRNPEHYSDADYAAIEKEKEDAEVQEFEDIMHNELPLLAHALDEGHAVSYSNLDAKKALAER